jgi:hypothetical protein
VGEAQAGSATIEDELAREKLMDRIRTAITAQRRRILAGKMPLQIPVTALRDYVDARTLFEAYRSGRGTEWNVPPYGPAPS